MTASSAVVYNTIPEKPGGAQKKTKGYLFPHDIESEGAVHVFEHADVVVKHGQVLH